MATCEELKALATHVDSPLHYIDRQGNIKFGEPDPPVYPSAPARMVSNLPQVASMLGLLRAPDKDLETCPAVSGFLIPQGRARAITAIARYLTSVNPLFAAPVASQIIGLYATTLQDPRASKSPSDPRNHVIIAVAEAIRDDKRGLFDTGLWLPLWGWANGGPHGAAPDTTRVAAAQALTAIVNRGRVTAGEARNAKVSAAALLQTANSRSPALRNAASMLAAAIHEAQQIADTPPAGGPPLPDNVYVPPASSQAALPRWVIPVGGVALAASLILFYRAHQRLRLAV